MKQIQKFTISFEVESTGNPNIDWNKVHIIIRSSQLGVELEQAGPIQVDEPWEDTGACKPKTVIGRLERS